MSDKSIYIFDSGVGGITLLHLAMGKMPTEHFTYYADVANAPYGNKSSSDVLNLVLKCIEGIDSSKIKALVLACNTATSIAVNTLRSNYDYPIIGMEPAIKSAHKLDKTKKIVLLATELTLKEEKLNILATNLGINNRLIVVPAPQLVHAAENFEFDTPEIERTIDTLMHDIDLNEVSAVVLGCTHFLYFKPHLKKILPQTVKIIDGHHGTVNHLYRQINSSNDTPSNNLSCLLSGMSVDSEFLIPYLTYCDRNQINNS